MKIGMIDVDGHNFPNLVLMKLSAWHKAQGDTVEWWWGFGEYDRVYMSKVFDSTYSQDVPEPLNAREIIKGGTGYGLDNRLPDEVEHIYPDYSLYPEMTKNTAYGFLTRGCPRGCHFCIVAEKDGRLMVLPCKRGDTLWSLYNYPTKGICEIVITAVSTLDGVTVINTNNFGVLSEEDVGKTVFLTREEAEAALKKREEEDDETVR